MLDPSIPRDSRRVPLETRVQLKFEKFSGFISEFSANISPGGIFIRTEQPAPVGTLVDFEFRLGDGFELIKGRGEVVWTRDPAPDASQISGMGLRFLELTPQAKELIYKVVDRHVQSGGVPFDPSPPIPPSTPSVATLPKPTTPPVPPLARPAPQEPPIRDADRLLRLFEEAAASVDEAEGAERASRPTTDPRSGPPAAGDRAPAARFPELAVPPSLPQTAPPAAVPIPPPELPPPLERSWAGKTPILAPPPEVPLRPIPSLLDDTASTTTGALIPPEPAARVQRKRRRPLRWFAASLFLALLLGGVAAWRVKDLWWDDFFGESDPEPLPAAFANPERKPMYRSLPGAAGPASPGGPVAGAPDSAAGAAPPGPNAQGASPPTETPMPAPADGLKPEAAPSAATTPAPAKPGATTLPPTSGAPSTPVPAIPAKTAEPAAEAPRPVLSELRSVSVRALAGETEVVLRGDGIIRSSNFAHFRIDTGSPRELVRLKGIRHAYSATKVAGGTPELTQIRIGYHSPDELHVVFDLAGAEIFAKSVSVSGSDLVIRLGPK